MVFNVLYSMKNELLNLLLDEEDSDDVFEIVICIR